MTEKDFEDLKQWEYEQEREKRNKEILQRKERERMERMLNSPLLRFINIFKGW